MIVPPTSHSNKRGKVGATGGFVEVGQKAGSKTDRIGVLLGGSRIHFADNMDIWCDGPEDGNGQAWLSGSGTHSTNWMTSRKIFAVSIRACNRSFFFCAFHVVSFYGRRRSIETDIGPSTPRANLHIAHLLTSVGTINPPVWCTSLSLPTFRTASRLSVVL